MNATPHMLTFDLDEPLGTAIVDAYGRLERFKWRPNAQKLLRELARRFPHHPLDHQNPLAWLKEVKNGLQKLQNSLAKHRTSPQ